MTDHISKDFDRSIESARRLVAQMGARVERQLADAVRSLETGSPSLIDQILRHENEVNGLERAIDELTGQIIARRQPAARDLRLLMALQTVTTDLERVGDEAKKIALAARSLFATGWPVLARVRELRPMAALVHDMLHEGVLAIEHLDPQAAARLSLRDQDANARFVAVLRRLVGFMVEDPRSISACIEILFVAKSLERVGDHAKNLAEHAVYAAVGEDVRHASPQDLERLLHQ